MKIDPVQENLCIQSSTLDSAPSSRSQGVYLSDSLSSDDKAEGCCAWISKLWSSILEFLLSCFRPEEIVAPSFTPGKMSSKSEEKVEFIAGYWEQETSGNINYYEIESLDQLAIISTKFGEVTARVFCINAQGDCKIYGYTWEDGKKVVESICTAGEKRIEKLLPSSLPFKERILIEVRSHIEKFNSPKIVDTTSF